MRITQTEVGKFYNVTAKEIKAPTNTNIVLAMSVAMYLAREMTDNSFQNWKEFGGRDHSNCLTCMSLQSKNMIAQDDSLRIQHTISKIK